MKTNIRFIALLIAITATFIPRANAAEIAVFNFEDSTLGGLPDFASDVPPGALSSTITTNYSAGDMRTVAGIPLNVAAGDADPNNLALGLSRTSGPAGTFGFLADFDIPLFTSLGIQGTSLSFAYNSLNNGFFEAKLFYSTNGGASFADSGLDKGLQNNGTNQVVSFAVPMAADNAPNLELRIELSGGSSSGTEVLTTIDNIQVTGTINSAGVPDTGSTFGLLALALAALFGASRLRSTPLV